MKAYSVSGSNASASSNHTLVNVIGSTSVRPRLFDLVVGSSATPADQAMQLSVSRFTTVGTAGSSPTPTPLDPGDIAAVATAGAAHSGEPGYTVGLLSKISLNQRATFRWVATPGAELVSPATASNGIGLYLVSATTALIEDGTIVWYE
ncbi:MAG TPA: hypothetical protein VK797_23210 [Tepidisphaeraceae bacterium]|jgi:hypothetical protein|nr:hypothetical protein [Tepidisphaeraceae bacterium]